MYEIIIDCTNKCVFSCKYCGTASQRQGDNHLNTTQLFSVLAYAKEIDALVYLGGGCFFCHPDWEKVLLWNKTYKTNLHIDVPLSQDILNAIQEYSPAKYFYNVSVSLWGLRDLHNKLTNTTSYDLLPVFLEVMRNSKKTTQVSFVVTCELINNVLDVIEFINSLGNDVQIYFHRLMPSGRCSPENLPSLRQIQKFSSTINSHVSNPNAVIYHHTINGSSCRAFRNRIFINHDGSVFGCGWINKKSKSVGNIYNIDDIADIINKAMYGRFDSLNYCIIK